MISAPNHLDYRSYATIPACSKKKDISDLMIARHEDRLCFCASQVENDSALVEEMKEWDSTIADGIKEADAERQY